MARPAGLEPAAYGFEVRRSIQLSYGRTTVHHTMQIYAGSLRSLALARTIRAAHPNRTREEDSYDRASRRSRGRCLPGCARTGPGHGFAATAATNQSDRSERQ